jgi:hypothetical protein
MHGKSSDDISKARGIIQVSQASKSRECATRHRCNRVEVHVPARGVCETHAAMTVHGYIQCSQASQSSKCAISNRCDLVAVQGPTQAVFEKSRRDVTGHRYIQVSQASKL